MPIDMVSYLCQQIATKSRNFNESMDPPTWDEVLLIFHDMAIDYMDIWKPLLLKSYSLI